MYSINTYIMFIYICTYIYGILNIHIIIIMLLPSEPTCDYLCCSWCHLIRINCNCTVVPQTCSRILEEQEIAQLQVSLSLHRSVALSVAQHCTHESTTADRLIADWRWTVGKEKKTHKKSLPVQILYGTSGNLQGVIVFKKEETIQSQIR